IAHGRSRATAPTEWENTARLQYTAKIAKCNGIAISYSAHSSGQKRKPLICKRVLGRGQMSGLFVRFC
ncbi:MAG: hypothetical protein RSF00_08305, partial [Oscillospiraceae bacterium]